MTQGTRAVLGGLGGPTELSLHDAYSWHQAVVPSPLGRALLPPPALTDGHPAAALMSATLISKHKQLTAALRGSPA
jgi:hypothetical protein